MMPVEGISPGNVAVYKPGSKLRAVDRRLKVAELALRIAICCFGVLAAALIGSDTQVREFFSVEKKARFTDMKALVFLVAANGMAAGYSLMQGARCVSSMVKGAVLLNKALALGIFSFDQAMAYLALAAVASAAQSAELGKFGQPELQWMKICSLYGKFCTKVGEGIASALLAGLCMVTVSSISAFNAFRLYGKSKGGGGGSSSNSKSNNTSW